MGKLKSGQAMVNEVLIFEGAMTISNQVEKSQLSDTAKRALADTTSKRIGVSFTQMGGIQQTVPVNAAAANLLGVLKMDTKDFLGAQANFKQALTLYPAFAGAKDNLDNCEKNLKKAPVKSPAKPKGN